MILKIKKILLLSLYASSVLIIASDKKTQDLSDLFATLTKKSEELYQAVKPVHASPNPADLVIKTSDATTSANNTKSPDIFPYTPPHTKQKSTSYPKFSDGWFTNLFKKCKDYYVDTKEIDCDLVLRENPKWQPIKEMSDQSKALIMRNALSRKYESDDNCNLACAICIGGNPDTRLENIDDPHTALHIVAGANQSNTKHFGLFALLLKKGANPNLKCMPAHPLEFAPTEEYRELLIKHGSVYPDKIENKKIIFYKKYYFSKT